MLGTGQHRDGGGGGGGGDRTEMEVETKDRRKKEGRGVLKEFNKVFAFFLSHSFSSIAHPAALCDTPKHHPGLYAVRSQLALEESAVGEIITFHSTKAVEW